MRSIRDSIDPTWLLLACVVGLGMTGCDRGPERDSALLLAQAQFIDQKTADGKTRSVPGPAKIVLVYPDADRWIPEVIEDSDANVFHKAMAFNLPGETPGILSIGANRAPLPGQLKVWRRAAGAWQAEVLWEGRFGGKFNRLRDVEIGDVTGDGSPELVIATHDQGVVAVLQRQDGVWAATEIDREPRRFVHEIELGDVDGDGRNEIFATPSAPNKVDGTPQPGWIVMYRYDGQEFSRQVVEEFDERHVKEILVADVEGRGQAELYAVLEVQLGKRAAGEREKQDAEIRRYRLGKAGFEASTIASLPDKQCRFLNAGDVDGDGRTELVASGFRSGLWLVEPDGEGWSTRLIDRDSSGYEHATTLADMDGDGAPEIYVASDDQRQLRRYRWNGESFERTELLPLAKGDITFGLMPCLDSASLGAE
jgi:hypothetical protein